MKKKIFNVLLWTPLVFYAVFLIWNIVFKYVMPWELFSEGRYFSRSFNLIPFQDLLSGNYNRLDIWGNIIIFIPMGMYCALFHKKNAKSILLFLPMAVSLLFEILQYVLAIGATDVTDILTNTFGGIIGIALYRILAAMIKSDAKAERVIAVLSSGTMLLVMVTIALIFLTNS